MDTILCEVCGDVRTASDKLKRGDVNRMEGDEMTKRNGKW